MNNTPKILIVDDYPKNVKLLEAHLIQTGFETVAAYDGDQAMAIIKEDPPDLVLLDAMMPVVDGFEVCKRIKENEKTRLIPVVMVTALDQLEDKVRGIEAGADDFLTKPVNRHELIARSRALVKTKRLNDQVLNLQSVVASLFEITTFEKQFSDRQFLFQEFSIRAAKLAQAKSVAITIWDGDRISVEASHNLDDEIYQQTQSSRKSAVKHVMESGQMLVVHSFDEDHLQEFGLYGGYIGIPLVSISGKTFGALHAFGVSDRLAQEPLRMLILVAQRLGYELQLKDYNTKLEDEVNKRTSELRTALVDLKNANLDLSMAQAETIFRLAKAAEYRDEDTAAHLHRMSNYSFVIAKQMGMEADFCNELRLAATMHDVGKIGTPDSILLKKGKLTPDEYEIMKEHTLIGAKILGGSSSQILRMSEIIALCHHEKFNGEGYPRQLKETEIPIEARIVAIADVFDALVTKRVYKRAFSIEESLSILKRDSGSHFDPRVYGAFMESFDEILSIRKKYPDYEND